MKEESYKEKIGWVIGWIIAIWAIFAAVQAYDKFFGADDLSATEEEFFEDEMTFCVAAFEAHLPVGYEEGIDQSTYRYVLQVRAQVFERVTDLYPNCHDILYVREVAFNTDVLERFEQLSNQEENNHES